MAAGAHRPRRCAADRVSELVSWIDADYKPSDPDASELLSKVAKIHPVEMVDPNSVVIAAIDKKYLPGR